ncbi:unnamed protein product [Penicillium pancosmium]
MAPIDLRPEVIAELRKLIETSCKERQSDLPCAEVVIVGDGSRHALNLFEFSVSPTTENEPRDLEEIEEKTIQDSDDYVYWLASCTKLVTAIACMQLVERGQLDLDDADQLASLCPELSKIKVIGKNGDFESQMRPITLRMLLTHRAYNEFSGNAEDFHQSLVNQPGEQFEYGIGLDWVGMAIEGVTRQRLNEYIQKSIFEPLGVKDVSMLPSKALRERLVGIWQRSSEGHLTPRDYPLNKPLDGDTTPEDIFNSGGAGLFGNVKEFSKILTVLLNDGKSPVTDRRILKPETVRKMFTNQIPEQPDFARRELPAVKPDLVYPVSELYPLCGSQPQGWGLSFMISPSITGRCDTTAQWSGLSNVFWWCDREKGIAGIVGSQILPFVDQKTAELWMNVEQGVYRGLS